MKRPLFFFFCVLLLLPVALWAVQDTPTTRVEITGVNPADLPTIVVNAAVYDRLGQPVFGLTAENFAIKGPLAEQAHIVSVENVSDDQLAFAVVLAIDTSSSMSGLPLDKAKEAAANFINSIGPKDPVAIISFDSNIQLVQDYTTDKDVLNNAIASLASGGKTALYKGALDAVNKAAESPTSRRAMIILSDGAEYGSISGVEREAALNQAAVRGVPVYTIGLGYGIDRTYLQEISRGTNARFYESPTPDELVSIYNGLAATLRSQYIITIEANVPGDGTEYPLTLEVTTPEGAVSTDATVRVPIITPIVTLPDLPTEPITEPVTITADVRADAPITAAQFQLDGAALADFTEPPYSITLDPVQLRPGTHTLSFSASDENGVGVGQASGTVEIAVLPSTVTVVGLGREAIAEPRTVTLEVTGQTPATGAAFSIDGGEPTTVTDAPYSFTIDPAALAPGEHTLSVDVTNAGGATASVSQPFTVAALPPQVTITGLENQPEISQPVDITVNASGQTAVSGVVVAINGKEAASTTEVPTTVTIDPAALQPGQNTLTATVRLESGQSAAATAEFTVAALPPQLTITGIQAGETIVENRTVTVEADSQTTITNVVFALDGQEVATERTAPYTFELDVLSVKPGAHILTAAATNTGGKSASADIAFMVSEAPSLTATASAMPTDTPTPTNTPTATPTPSPTMTFTATIDTSATAAQSALLAQQATGTADILAANAQGTASGEQTLQAQEAANNAATAAVQATSGAQATAAVTQTLQAQAVANNAAATSVQATQNAGATANVQATADARAAANAMATTNAQATLNTDLTATAETIGATATAIPNITATANAAAANATQSAATQNAAVALTETQDAQGTRSAVATQNAEARTTEVARATESAALVATQSSQVEINAQATRNAEARATTNAQLTLDAQETINAQATQNAAAISTANAQATRDAQATINALATQNAASLATANAQLTLDAQATLDALATQNAAETATANAQATLDAQATQNAAETATALMTATQNAQATRDAQATATAIAQATRDALATQNTAATATANAQMTLDARATATASALETQNAHASATANAQATLDAQASLVAQATAEPTQEATQAAPTREPTTVAQVVVSPTSTESDTDRTPVPTLTPIGTLTIETVPGTTAASTDILPIVLIIIVVIIVLIIIFLLLRGRRARNG